MLIICTVGHTECLRLYWIQVLSICNLCRVIEDYVTFGLIPMLCLTAVCSFSHILASDVLITMQSILNSIVMLLEKSVESNGKNMHVGCSKEIIPFLQKHLVLSAHKLLTYDFPSEDAENGRQSKVSYNTL